MDSTAQKNKILIRVEDVSFHYGHQTVLSHVSLDMHTGDFLAVIGPNGSGKTTLIKIILGLLEPDQGRVKILGRSLGGFSEWSKLGYVPQNATHVDPFFPVSVKEVVDMGLIKEARSKQAGKEKGMEAISWALKQVDMEDQQNHRIGNLSGGQQQRVFIARAIVNKPVILFLDEPTTGVDAETQDRFYEMLGVLNKKEKMTIVLVTHDIGIVNKHVNRVACLNQKLIYHGDHDEFCRSEAFKSMLEGGHHLVSHRH